MENFFLKKSGVECTYKTTFFWSREATLAHTRAWVMMGQIRQDIAILTIEEKITTLILTTHKHVLHID